MRPCVQSIASAVSKPQPEHAQRGTEQNEGAVGSALGGYDKCISITVAAESLQRRGPQFLSPSIFDPGLRGPRIPRVYIHIYIYMGVVLNSLFPKWRTSREKIFLSRNFRGTIAVHDSDNGSFSKRKRKRGRERKRQTNKQRARVRE